MKLILVLISMIGLIGCNKKPIGFDNIKVDEEQVNSINNSIIAMENEKKSGLVRRNGGEYVYPWREKYSCDNVNRCGNSIINEETGEVAYVDSSWHKGFKETGNGHEVIKLDNK